MAEETPSGEAASTTASATGAPTEASATSADASAVEKSAAEATSTPEVQKADPAPEPKNQPETQTEKPLPKPAEPPSEVDRILAKEDPEFTKSLGELAGLSDASGVDVDSDVDKIVAREKTEPDLKGWPKVKYILFVRSKRRLKEFRADLRTKIATLKKLGFAQIKTWAILFLKNEKYRAIKLYERTVESIKFVLGLKRQTKLIIVLATTLVIASGAALRIAFTREFMPKFESQFLRSFADIADAKFTYNKGDPMEDFNNPLLHPEHVVLIERIVANLKPPGDGSNPMALIDVYIEVGTQEAAVELKDRESEVRDVVGRTLEAMPYDELVNAQGKSRFKIVLRKNLNEFLTKGRARRIYFKSIVLKP
jgi:flagellar basal body-associated protein FliL